MAPLDLAFALLGLAMVAPSNGAQYLDYLRLRAEELDAPPAWKKLPPDYDQQCYQAHWALRRHAAYLIDVGVRV